MAIQRGKIIVRLYGSQKNIHHRDAEYAEFEVFLHQELFTPRSPRRRGAISEAFVTTDWKRGPLRQRPASER
jgi:hypothetical protein